MRPIPSKLRQQLANDPRMKTCARSQEMGCRGSLTWEHSIIIAGRQLNEPWAILSLCEYHHSVNQYQDRGDLKKEYNRYLAYKQATIQDLAKYPKANFQQEKDYLMKKYDKKD